MPICFWDTTVPCGSENSHHVVQLSPNEDKYYPLTPYPNLKPVLKKFLLKAYWHSLITQT